MGKWSKDGKSKSMSEKTGGATGAERVKSEHSRRQKAKKLKHNSNVFYVGTAKGTK